MKLVDMWGLKPYRFTGPGSKPGAGSDLKCGLNLYGWIR